MTIEIINVGAVPNDGLGDPLRDAYIKCNNNFAELYSRLQTTAPTTIYGSAGDLAGMTSYDSSGNFYYCYKDYDGLNEIWRQVVGTVF